MHFNDHYQSIILSFDYQNLPHIFSDLILSYQYHLRAKYWPHHINLSENE
jgi:hypothetical protein